jgi:hypothetical protein
MPQNCKQVRGWGISGGYCLPTPLNNTHLEVTAGLKSDPLGFLPRKNFSATNLHIMCAFEVPSLGDVS